jgi:tetrapyrrole methylase family protein/MazG family protein
MTPRPRVLVVGLGPGGHDHITKQTLDAIERIDHRFLRTSQHTSAHVVPDAVSCDDLYDNAATFDAVYHDIVDRLADAAAAHGEVLYAVPGSPLILERSVSHLLADDRVDVEIFPAMSFLDIAWVRLGIDPIEAGVRLIDGHEFAVAAAGQTGSLLVAHTHANWVLSEIKLSIDSEDIADTAVTLLRALGTDEEQIVETTWADMDRAIEADHLTTLFIPRLGEGVGGGYVRFHELARTLRERCSWDIEQTHRSLVPYLIEETYEVVDAIAALNPDDPASDELLIEELGDLLYQIEFHSTIAEQQGRFTIADVTNGIHEKLVRRHPHVFGDVDTNIETAQVLDNWEAIKRDEKNRTSTFDGVPSALPALAYAEKLQKKAAKTGFDWPDVAGALPKIAEEAAELVEATQSDDPVAVADELGDLLFACVNVARHLGVDAESALRAASNKFRTRFESVEVIATERGIDLQASDLSVLDNLWDEVKRTERARPD